MMQRTVDEDDSLVTSYLLHYQIDQPVQQYSGLKKVKKTNRQTYKTIWQDTPWSPGGPVVKVLNSGPRGRAFDSRPVSYQVATLGKLFTPTCLCRCTWSSGWCRLVAFRLRFDSHRG